MLDLVPDAVRAFAIEQAGRLLLADDPGPTIRELRTRFGMTQAQLAECVDLRRETLSRIEAQGQSPSADALRELVRVFALAHAAREHAAEQEARGGRIDPRRLHRIASGLRLDADVADRVILEALSSYGGKRETILDDLEAKR